MKYKRYNHDILKRKLYKNTELIQRLKTVCYLSFNTKLLQWVLSENNYKQNYFKNRIKNFCVISGRSKGVYRKFKISRIVLRELSAKGIFFGLKKASW
uniref:Ribosomal protein S14 n=1 Tax=Rhizaria sp. TaxID=2204297 RepID=A0A5P8DJS4_9EUKA|nr:ribosomal protein S14 [Rhizaria sp.]